MQGTHDIYPHYPADVLAYRPLEHILEDCSCRRLAGLLHVNKDTATLIKRDPYTYGEHLDERYGNGWSYDEIDKRVRSALENEVRGQV